MRSAVFLRLAFIWWGQNHKPELLKSEITFSFYVSPQHLRSRIRIMQRKCNNCTHKLHVLINNLCGFKRNLKDPMNSSSRFKLEYSGSFWLWFQQLHAFVEICQEAKTGWMKRSLIRFPLIAHKVLSSARVLQAALWQHGTGSQGPCLAEVSRNFPLELNYF